jgi:ATP-dependent RNA helicase MSS116, mitochondrial
LTKHVPTILVATPGRLRDHLQTTNINGRPFAQLLARTKILVLDETDRYARLAVYARM